jgi:hypothetical protein
LGFGAIHTLYYAQKTLQKLSEIQFQVQKISQEILACRIEYPGKSTAQLIVIVMSDDEHNTENLN